MPPYTLTLLSNPANGTLTGTLPDLLYTPNLGFAGTDSFNFRATNQTGESATGTISIQIVSDLAATSQTINTRYSSNIPITLSATGGWPPLTYLVLTGTAHGTLNGTPPNMTYVPNPPYLGSDSFSFQVTDEGGFTSIGTVSLTTTWDLSAEDQVVSTASDSVVDITLSGLGGEPPYTFDVTSRYNHSMARSLARHPISLMNLRRAMSAPIRSSSE